MLFWTHLIVGIFGILLFISRYENWLGFLVFGIIGSVFLDIDSHNSKLGKKFLSRVSVSFTKHRGFIHSFLFVFLIYLILYYLFGSISTGFLIGGIIHLILDSFTIQGVKLFFPLKYRFRSFVRSGGFFEIILFLIFLILDVFLVFGLMFS